MSDFQRDIERLEMAVMTDCSTAAWETWLRLKPRLTPDRERVARALYEHAIANQGAVKWEGWLAKADAAIAAMGEP